MRCMVSIKVGAVKTFTRFLFSLVFSSLGGGKLHFPDDR